MDRKKVCKKSSAKKKIMSIELKREIIEKHEQGVRVVDLSRQYGRSTSMICSVLKRKESIKSVTPAKGLTIISKLRTSLHENMEKVLMVWVAWIHKNRYTLLTLQNRVITRSSRYKVSHNSCRTWWLHITNVQERDRGEYMCQINTVQMIKQVGYLEVVVPPYLDEELTSSDKDVREGTDVSLRCVAKGSPEPEVTWRREDGQEISIGKSKGKELRNI
ncbi:lachesin [Trichonephila inaurata madagascariensis]|uniref:Lachesin n=1 Tax=Trichonephila inaurata madagascariensis TaxID=2747483 RepID=A0A8X7C331_9ARAC|nr:lachesin [Trichonephila inaurata madagascariensis]